MKAFRRFRHFNEVRQRLQETIQGHLEQAVEIRPAEIRPAWQVGQEVDSFMKRMRRRIAARKLLRQRADATQGGEFSIKPVPRHIARLHPTQRHIRVYPRLSMPERKTVERYLKFAHPKLNRTERRHLRDKHRWMLASDG